jgi:hypothetical protein
VIPETPITRMKAERKINGFFTELLLKCFFLCKIFLIKKTFSGQAAHAARTSWETLFQN